MKVLPFQHVRCIIIVFNLAALEYLNVRPPEYALRASCVCLCC